MKLHGSVGIGLQENHFGQETHASAGGSLLEAEVVGDSLFQQAWVANPHDRVDPYIVFPSEKRFVVAGHKSSLAFRDLLTAVWEKAKILIDRADEIHFIGYSFAAEDASSVMALLQQARPDVQVRVQDPNAHALCNMLAIHYPWLDSRLVPIPSPF